MLAPVGMAKLGEVGVPLLGSDNYPIWSVKMRMLLTHQQLWQYVHRPETPTAVQAAPGAAQGAAQEAAQGAASVLTDAQKADDAKALSIIGRHVKDYLIPSIAGCNTAKEAWSVLERLFMSSTNAHRMTMRHELTSLRKGVTEPLVQYFARACQLRDSLARVGCVVSSEDLAMAVLCGLPRVYDTIVEILQTELNSLDLDQVMARLLVVEARNAKHNDRQQESSALFASQQRRSHPGKDYGQQRVKRGACHFCGKHGHWKRDCPNRRAASGEEDKKGKSSHQGSSGSTGKAFHACAFNVVAAETGPTCLHIESTFTSYKFKDGWILDSGASHHMTPERGAFCNYTKADIPVKLGNGKVVRSFGKGDVGVAVVVDGVQKVVQLRNVLHVPDLITSLMSVPRIAAWLWL